MKKIKFYYSTKLTFDNNVAEHTFALRCTPLESASQHLESINIQLSPDVTVDTSNDSFGNIVTSGYIKDSHRFLDITSSGVVTTDYSKKKIDFMPCYKSQSAMTKPDKSITEFYNSISENAGTTIDERAKYFSDKVNEIMTYEKGVTDMSTTAAQTFEMKKGVCQDFSHILLSLLRLDGISSRYIAGLAFCDGETHSWVEYWNGEYWTGIDPTNGCLADEDYIVLSQGRDVIDSSVSRGIMFGGYTRQMQLVETKLSVTF